MRLIVYNIISFLLLLFCIDACKSNDSSLNVIEGKYADETLYPTVVLLYDFNYDEEVDLSLCSGVIVSENVVLTAAHCLVDIDENDSSETPSYKIKGRGVMIEDVLVGGTTPIILPECEKNFLKDKNILRSKVKLDDDYSIYKSISREDYEKQVLSLKKQYSGASYDIGALVFDNRTGKDDPPFRPIIEKARKQGKVFTLSKKVFEDGTFINENEKSLFFLGYGLSSKRKDLNDPLAGKEGLGKLQIGNNTVKYSKTKSEWYTPKTTKGKISSHTASGDSGGPLVYNNQILGVSSYGTLYDCEGNDIYLDPLSDRFIGLDSNGKKLDVEECLKDECCSKIVDAGSYFASFTLGSNLKYVELLFKKVKEELIKKNLLETNSIFSEF